MGQQYVDLWNEMLDLYTCRGEYALRSRVNRMLEDGKIGEEVAHRVVYDIVCMGDIAFKAAH